MSGLRFQLQALSSQTSSTLGPHKCPCLDLTLSLLHQYCHSPWSFWTTSPVDPLSWG